MGNFSWIAKNGNPIKIGKPAWMVFKLCNEVCIVNECYEGYGKFDDIDYYITLFKMNNNNYHSFSDNTMREYGIDMEFGGKDGLIFPQLFDHEPTPQEIDAIDWSYQCESDPRQGD